MKRLLPAAVLAVTIHVAVWWLIDNLLPNGGEITRPVANIVTVTMSYRTPAPTPVSAEKPIKKQRPRKAPKPPKSKPPNTDPIKPDKAAPTPPEIELPAAAEEEDTSGEETTAQLKPGKQADSGPESDTHGNSISNMTAPVDAVPLYNINPPPAYPRRAIKRGWQGTVELMVLVNKDGDVDDLWLYASSGYAILDQAALDSVKKWSFSPGRHGSRNVDMWVRVPVRFQLQ